MKSSTWSPGKATLLAVLLGITLSVGVLFNRGPVGVDDPAPDAVAEKAERSLQSNSVFATSSLGEQEITKSSDIETRGVPVDPETVLRIAGQSYSGESIREWDYMSDQKHRIHGILELPEGGAAFFKAEHDSGEMWDLQKIAYLGEYVIPNDGSAAAILKVVHAAGFGMGEVLETGSYVSRLGFPVSTLERASSLDRYLAERFGAEKIEANSLVFPVATPDDPDYAGSWTLAKLELEPVWEAYGFSPEGALGRRPVIAVVDNGAPDNGEFHMWTNEGEIEGNGIDDDGNYHVDDIQGYNFVSRDGDLSYAGSHGTRVARIAASLTHNGIGQASPASSAALMRVLYYESVNGSHYAAVDGLYYGAINQVDVINCSFVSTSSIMMIGALRYAADNDVLVVAGAGNNGKDLETYPLFPAALVEPNLITVGASNSSDVRANSNYSDTLVHLFAPATATSYSAPLVSSTVALLRALDPDATYSEIREAILAGVDPIESMAGECVSGGRLNVRGAVETLLGVTLGGGGDPVPPADPVISVDAIGVASVSLSWNTGETVDSFEVEVSESGSGFHPLEPTAMFGGETTSVEVEGLTASTDYVFRLRAVVGALTSNWVESAPVTTLTPEPPYPPGLWVGAIGSTSLDVAWAFNGEADGFELQISEGGGPFGDTIQFNGGDRSFSISALDSNTGYEFRLRAVRHGLVSVWTRLALATLPAPEPEPQPEPKPVAPVAPSLLVGEVGIGSVDLNWTAEADVDRYELQLREKSTSFKDAETLFVEESGVSLTGLRENTVYRFRIRAVRDGLPSAWTLSGEVNTLAPAPEAPADPSVFVEVIGPRTALVEWTHTDTVHSFELEALLGMTEVIQLGKFPASEGSVEVDGLESGATYSFRIRAIRDGLKSSWVESDVILTPRADLIGKHVHHWSFDFAFGGVAADSKRGLDLAVDPVLAGEGIGSSASGLHFSGAHGGLPVPDASTLNGGVLDEFTLSLWIKLDPRGAALTSCVYEQGGYWRGLNLVIDQGWLIANGWNRPAKESDWRGTELMGGRIPVGEWTHVALVLKAGESITEDGLKLYVNGQQVDAGPASMLWQQNDENGFGQVMQSTVYAGRQIRKLDDFQGCLDEVSIWHAALTGAEIKDHILSGSQ